MNRPHVQKEQSINNRLTSFMIRMNNNLLLMIQRIRPKLVLSLFRSEKFLPVSLMNMFEFVLNFVSDSQIQTLSKRY